MATDVAGNIYVTGRFFDPVDFDSGPGTYALSSAGFDDTFVAKYTSDGTIVWARCMGSTEFDGGRDIVVATDGSVYTTGYFSGTVDFDPGPGTFNLTASLLFDTFVWKLDAAGNFVWARSFGGPLASDSTGHGIALAVDGSVYTTGRFTGTADFDPGPGTFNLTAEGDDVFVWKLDTAGSFVWAKRMGGRSHTEGYDVAVAPDGSVYTTGGFYTYGPGFEADFDPGPGTFNLATLGTTDIFLSKLDADGNFVWARALQGDSGTEEGIAVAVAPDGSVCTVGYFNHTVDFDPGPGIFNLTSAKDSPTYATIFVSKLDAAGSFVWAKPLGGGGMYDDQGNGIAVGSDGSVYTTGGFDNTGDFDPGPGTFNLTGDFGAFVSKLDAAGNFVWAGSLADGGSATGGGLVLAPDGSIYTTGMSRVGDFDPGPDTFNLVGFGMYVSKLYQTDVALGNANVAENSQSGTAVGILSTVHSPTGNTFTYTLVPGSEDTDNASFTIVGAQLKTAAVLDYETKSSYSIRVRSTDQDGVTCDKVLAITVTDVNEAPTDITLAGSSVVEDQASGTAVGTFSTVDPEALAVPFTYALVAGTGGDDNESFTIVGSQLRTAASFDFETKSSYSIRVRSTDPGGLWYEESLTITVTRVDEIPPTVTGTTPSFATSGTLVAGMSLLAINFSEPMVGGDLAANYQLQSLGPDGLLGTTDDLIFSLNAVYSGTQATLSFTNLPTEIYRLTVRDTITDSAGNALDGDANGTLGGNWTTDFVVVPSDAGSFESGAAYPTAAYSKHQSIAVGDFNGDGTSDLITANSGSDNVAVFTGDGTGAFRFLATYASGGSQPMSVVLGDFNGDGNPDLALANSGSNNVGILLNNGTGGFGAAVTYASGGSSPRSVTVGDFNADGKTDLAVANANSNNIGVLLNNGAGGFVAAVTHASGGLSPYSVAVGDFNADGKPDLALANSGSNNVGVLLNNGAGGFAAAVSFASGGSFPSSVAVGDFNADGKPDLALANGSSNVGVMLNSGAGGFSAAVTYASGGSYAMSVAVGDFNGDGKPDLALANGSSNNVGILLNNGFGWFVAAVTYASGGSYPRSVAVGDFNGDGKPDLALANSGSNNVGVLLNDGAGGFSAAVTYASGGSNLISVTVGDFNADGKPDLALANYDSNNVGVLINNGAGWFVAAVTYASGGSSPYSVAAGDFNGDGKPDLALANASSDTVGILLNSGAGGFAAAVTYASGGSYPSSVAIGDFNADGKPDLALANGSGHNIAVLLNNSVGGFAVAVTYDSGGSSPRSVVVGDFNADGKPDLALANSGSNNVRVLMNNGTGGFVPASTRLAVLPLRSPHELTFGVQTDGFGAGQLVEGSNQAFDGVNRLRVAGQEYAPAIQGNDLADGNRTVVTPEVLLGGLYVHREMTVPNTGSEDFARTIEVFANITASAITVPVRVVGNLGSDAATTVFATSDGNTTVETIDQWIGTDDANGTGTPAIIHYIHGPGGLRPTSVIRTGDNIEWTYSLTVPAGQTVCLAHFTILANTRAEAVAAANVLVGVNGFGGQAAAFLGQDELSSLANFQFNRAPTDIGLSPASVAENQAAGTMVGIFTPTDPDLPSDSHTYTLVAGAGDDDNTSFTIVGSQLQAAASFDFETKSIYAIRVRTTDAGSLTYDKVFAITVTDVNEASTGVSLTNTVSTLPENADTSSSRKVADIVVTDDAMGTNVLSLSGADADLFELAGSVLYLKAGAALDFETNPALDVTIAVDDATVGGTPDATTALALTVTDANDPPVMAAIGDQSVAELTPLTFTASATDADIPANTLTYNLDAASLAAGMTINSATGHFGWTPTEVQGPGTYNVTVTVTDNGTPALSDAKSFKMTVNEVNVAPVLAAIGDQSVAELTPLSFTASAIDADIPANTLTYSLDAASLAAGMAINGVTGQFGWTPTEVQGPGTYNVTVSVTDNGTPALSDAKSFTITVNEVNVAPMLAVITDKTVAELTPLTFTASATDADIPANTLTYSLDVASLAAGMAINGATGQFSWTPTEVQGPGTYNVTVTATDNGTPALSNTKSFKITVNEVNVAPLLAAITDKTVAELTPLTFTASATDADIPANTLTYSLDATSLAAGMTIDGVTGQFGWTPTEDQSPGTYNVTVTVTDNGTPALSDAKSFQITVNEVNVAPVLAAIGNQSVDELTALTFTVSATDSDVPVQTLTYSATLARAGVLLVDEDFSAFDTATVWVPSYGIGGDYGPAGVVSYAGPTDIVTIGSVGGRSVVILDSTMGKMEQKGYWTNQTFSGLSDVRAELTFSPREFGVGTARAIDGEVMLRIVNPATGDGVWIEIFGGNSGETRTVHSGWQSGGESGFGFPGDWQYDAWYRLVINVGAHETTLDMLDALTGIPLFTSEAYPIGLSELGPFKLAILQRMGNPEDAPRETVVAMDQLTLTGTADRVTGLPGGANFDPVTRQFNWTPSEDQGPGTYDVTFVVSDGSLTDSETITITVNEVNVGPVLAAITDKTVAQLTPLTFTASASDADIPANTLTYSLDAASLAAGMTIDGVTGQFGWTPTEDQGPGTYNVTVTVTDNGTPVLSNAGTLMIVVAVTWQNLHHPCDITGDGYISPLDVLTLINDINANGSHQLADTTSPTPIPPPFLDPSGDGSISPLDALIVITYLNTYGPGPIPGTSVPPGRSGEGVLAGDGEGGPVSPSASLVTSTRDAAVLAVIAGQSMVDHETCSLRLDGRADRGSKPTTALGRSLTRVTESDRASLQHREDKHVTLRLERHRLTDEEELDLASWWAQTEDALAAVAADVVTVRGPAS